MNLIICCTPFQVLLAEKIIDAYPREKFIGVMFYKNINDKYRYYESRLARKCNMVYSFYEKKPYGYINAFLNNIRLYKIAKDIPKIETVFIANIDFLYIQMLLSKIRFTMLNTFDDGLANINRERSGLYFNNTRNFIAKLGRLFLGVKYDVDDLRKLSMLHYTIYPNIPNIISNTKNIRIFDKRKIVSLSDNLNKKIIKIYLGQPIFKDAEKNIDLVNKVYERIRFDMYYPHPREDYNVDVGECISSHLIFEDYILEKLIDKPNELYEIYTIFSGSVINVSKFPNVRAFALKLTGDEFYGYDDIYDLFRKNDIEIIDIDVA